MPSSDWKVALEGADMERQPFWGPGGNLIYFLSERDGTRCIWAQPVDKATGQSAGAPFAAHHMHQVRYNLIDVVDVAAIGLSVAEGSCSMRVRIAVEHLDGGAPADRWNLAVTEAERISP